MNEQIAKMMGWDESDLGARPHSSEFHWVKTAANGVREFVASSDDADFTESLDACFKWVVPWLIAERNIDNILFIPIEENEWCCELWIHPEEICESIVGVASTPAEAFCKAVMEVGCE